MQIKKNIPFLLLLTCLYLSNFIFPGINGTEIRAQSESSGDFSLSLDNEPWSNGSSPVQQPPSRRPSSTVQPPNETSTPQHTQLQKSPAAKPKEKIATTPKQKDRSRHT